MTVEIGERLSYSGEICTVRFIGEIPAWVGETAFGVEWDNTSKGKHDGSYKGVQYFNTTCKSAGSFLKSSKKYDEVRSFYKALIDTYATQVDEQEIKIGTKYVESYGFDKLQRLQSDLNYLKSISLSRKQINKAHKEEKELIQKGLVNLKELDLSFNLFKSLDEILDIITCLDINTLNLTGNRLLHASTKSRSTIKSLNLSLTLVDHSILDMIPSLFPFLEKIYLQDNNYEQFQAKFSNLTHLKQLDLSLNQLSSIPNIVASTSIINLNISDNNIKITHDLTTFTNITTLDIRRNSIETWKEVELLSERFPNVTTLRINGNILLENLTSEEADYNVIARWSSLTSLNGVKITEQERTNAELYFLSELNQGKFAYDDAKLQQLTKKHGRSVIVKNNTYKKYNKNIIHLTIKDGNKTIEVPFIQSIEVIRFRGMISRLIHRHVLDFQISYYIDTFKEIITNDLSLLSSFSFEDGQLLTIESLD